MKKLFIIFFASVFSTILIFANQDFPQKDNTIKLHGRILAADTQKPLVNASITLYNSNISSISNQDGYFSILIPSSAEKSHLIVRFLGYENREVSIASIKDKTNNKILLTPASFELDELQVISGDGRHIIQDALYKLSTNYPTQPNMMVAFYRESIKKGNNYISLVETVLDVYKASYRSYENDQAKIYIGRKASDASPRDTVLMKFQGGISSALMLDVAKNPQLMFGNNGEDYNFHIEGIVHINNKPHYAISFSQKKWVDDILFRGTAFVDTKSHAFSKIDFQMNVEDRKDAANLFIRKKPNKMKVVVDRAAYSVDYIEKEGKWFFNHSIADISFKVRWTNRFFGLFATTYSISSEIAITDIYNQDVNKFPRKERVQSTDVIAEKIEHFQDPYFWENYNVIEPEIEITQAIKRLSDKLQRRK